MKIYGYSKNTNKEPMELSEVTLSAKPDSLRELSEFLLKCAHEIENNPSDWEHEHFKSSNNEKSQIIVFNDNSEDD